MSAPVMVPPCSRDCGRCSQCTYAMSWASRGGRPFLGIALETALGCWPPTWRVNGPSAVTATGDLE